MTDQLPTVRCNGEQAYATTYLIGTGPPLPVYTSWAIARTSGTTKLKFFASEPTPAKQLLVTYQEDYGATSNGLSATWYSRIPDVALMPVAVYAIVPGYNMPELEGQYCKSIAMAEGSGSADSHQAEAGRAAHARVPRGDGLPVRAPPPQRCSLHWY